MSEGKREQTYDECVQPEEHRDHLCNLMDRGMTEEIRRRSDRPAFLCRNCGARANKAEDLCRPQPLSSTI